MIEKASDESSAVARRALRFTSMSEVRSEIDRLARGRSRTTGNWTLAQIVRHLADVIDGSIDGMPHDGRVAEADPRAKKMVLRRGLPTGFDPGDAARSLMPGADAHMNEAMRSFDRALGRMENEQMSARHPYFGAFTHKEWTEFHLRHAELHLSFAHPE